jgi:hypothetical protein
VAAGVGPKPRPVAPPVAEPVAAPEKQPVPVAGVFDGEAVARAA